MVLICDKIKEDISNVIKDTEITDAEKTFNRIKEFCK